MTSGPIVTAVLAAAGGLAFGVVIALVVVRPLAKRAARKRVAAELTRLAAERREQGQVPGLQEALERVRQADPEPVTRAAERLAALLGDPEAGDADIEKARAEYIAAARDALTD